jgi:peptide chain release factor 1
VIKIEELKSRLTELESLLADNDVMADQKRYQQLAKEYSDMTPILQMHNECQSLQAQFDDLTQVAADESDPELSELAAAELEELQPRLEAKMAELEAMINPVHEEQDRNLIFEIRAGTGGQEASLFAADLYRMYTKYADKNGWIHESISANESETGGFKEVIFSIKGKGASRRLKWESGGHRVQRVPATETQGRIHTSAATVAVLFEPEEVDIEIDQNDLKIDVFRSSGPGGQSVNTTDSAIRITHLPTGLVVICQDERSQLKNKYKAMRVLRARLMARQEEENREQAAQDRKLKVGSGDRSEKIRTYNFPERRVTDHRIGFTTYKLPAILDGDLDELTQAIIHADRAEADGAS